MLYYAANISQLYPGLPLPERFERISAAGFGAYELLFPQRESLAEVERLHDHYKLDYALFDLEVDADYPRGNMSAIDDRPFFYRLDEALNLACKFGTKRLNALVGFKRPDLSDQAQVELIVERLTRAADIAKDDGVMLLIEALNSRDNPGYFVGTSKRGIEIVSAVNRPNVRFQYDVYHMQIMEGNLIETIQRELPWIGHVQIADVPGRHEPGTGEINFPNVLAALESAGFDGYVGLELVPSSPNADPFAWLSTEERGRRIARE